MSTTAGSAASPRATPTRCCCPPESWRGVAVAVLARLQPDQRQQLVDAGGHLLAVPADQPGHDGDVLADREVREQPDLLDDVADAPPQLVGVDVRDVLPVEQDLPGGGLDEPVHHLQGGGLAAARRPDQRDDRAGRHVQVERVDGRSGLSRVDLRDAPQGDRRAGVHAAAVRGLRHAGSPLMPGHAVWSGA
jgi:hypothetical protein